MRNAQPKPVVPARSTRNGAAQHGIDGPGGGSAGPGQRPSNSFARRRAAHNQVFLETVTRADVEAIARKLLELAQNGDVARLLCQFLRR